MKKIRALLIFLPVAIALRFTSYHDSVMMFIVASLALIPLAIVLGDATEELSEHTGPAISGFLNATFGNAPELIIGLAGCMKGGEVIDVVKASLTGSILGNLLMITGLAMFLGGLKRKSQTFNHRTVGVTNTMMLLAVAGLMAPSTVYWVSSIPPSAAHGVRAQSKVVAEDGKTAAAAAANEAAHPGKETPPPSAHSPAGHLRLASRVELLSVSVAVLLIIVYLMCLVYSFHIERDLLQPREPPPEGSSTPKHGPTKPILTLLIATLFIAMLSEFLVGSLEVAGDALGLNPIFMGLVIISAIGNVAEHASAVMIAIKGDMDLCLSIAMGSSMQIALFVAPALVICSYLTGNHMNLVFTPLELVSVTIAVALVSALTSDGESNWLEGAQLLCVYFIMVLAFYFGF